MKWNIFHKQLINISLLSALFLCPGLLMSCCYIFHNKIGNCQKKSYKIMTINWLFVQGQECSIKRENIRYWRICREPAACHNAYLQRACSRLLAHLQVATAGRHCSSPLEHLQRACSKLLAHLQLATGAFVESL